MKKDNKKILRILLIVILIIVIIAGIAFVISKLFNKTKTGNTIGNIRNFGYGAEDDEYIFFMAPDKNGNLKTINRIDKKLEKDPKQLIAGDWDITGINVYNGYVYFVTLAENNNPDDKVDNKIHKMKNDGTEHKVINNNEFHNSCYEIYVVKDKLYYIGEDEGIYTMNLDGTDKKKMNGTATGFVGITDEYIFYNVIEGQADDEKIVTHIMKLDGSEDKVLTGDRLYAVNLIGDDIYYTDEDGHIFKVKLGETNSTMLSSITSYCLNVTSDGIYSLKYIDEGLTKQAIFKMDLDGKNEKMIKKLETTSTFLAVLEDWIIYLDSTETKGIIAMVSKDGKKYQELYSLDFTEYLKNQDIENLLQESDNQVENSIIQE